MSNSPMRRAAHSLLMVFAVSCGGSTEPAPPGDGPVPVAEVRITSPVSSLMLGASAQLVAEALDAGGSALANRGITWTSSNAATLSVTSTGRITGSKVGVATVTATSEGRSGSVQLEVSPVPVGQVVVTPALASIVPGTTTQLAAATSSATGTPLPGRPVTWSSADPAIAAVDAAGVVLGVKKGVVAITATSEGVSASASITVLPAVATVTVTPPLDSLYSGESVQLAVALADEDGAPLDGRAVQWESSTGAATVSQSGLVTAVLTGTAAIFARSGEAVGMMTVVVRPPPVDSVFIWPAAATIVVGGGLDLEAIPYDATGQVLSGHPVTFDATPDGIVALTHNHVAGESVGSVDVTATADEVVALARIRVVRVSFASVDGGTTQTCGLGEDGAAFCWGQGNGDMALSTPPRGVPGDPVFDQVRAGYDFSCGLAAGVTACWGVEPVTGEPRYEAEPVTGAPSFTDIDVGDEFACGLAAGGAAYCWGQNYLGQLGNGTTMASVAPIAVTGGRVFTALAAGGSHGCGLAATGEVYCWGGELGFVTPRLVSAGIAFTSITEGACGLSTGGVAYCWDDAQASPTPAPVPGHVFTSLTSRGPHRCGVKADGTAYCWGNNETGALGTGDFDSSPTPRAVTGGRHFVELAAGTTHTCGIATDGLLYCWGNGIAIGSGTGFGYATVPTLVTGQP